MIRNTDRLIMRLTLCKANYIGSLIAKVLDILNRKTEINQEKHN